MNLMVKHEWNNILHNFIEKIFINSLESDSFKLKNALINESNLLEFLISSTKDIDYVIPSGLKRKIRKGYLGHITKISNSLIKLKEKD